MTSDGGTGADNKRLLFDWEANNQRGLHIVGFQEKKYKESVRSPREKGFLFLLWAEERTC